MPLHSTLLLILGIFKWRMEIFMLDFWRSLKLLPSFCFPKSIPDNLSASTMQWQWEICKFSGSFFHFLKLEAKKTKVTLNWNCIRLQFCDPLNWIVNFEQPEKLAKKVVRLRSVCPIRLHILWTGLGKDSTGVEASPNQDKLGQLEINTAGFGVRTSVLLHQNLERYL